MLTNTTVILWFAKLPKFTLYASRKAWQDQKKVEMSASRYFTDSSAFSMFFVCHNYSVARSITMRSSDRLDEKKKTRVIEKTVNLSCTKWMTG